MADGMPEAETGRAPEGSLVCLGEEGWPSFKVEVGEVLEFSVNKEDGGMAFPIKAAMIVTAATDAGGQVGYYGRFIGSEDAGKNRELGNTINHRDRGVHLCQIDPCDALEGTWAAHVTRARWWTMQKFPRDYIKPWGAMVLDEGIRIGCPGEGVNPQASQQETGTCRQEIPRSREGPREETKWKEKETSHQEAREEARQAGGLPGKDGTREALRSKLKDLKNRLIGDGTDTKEEIIEIGESEDGGESSGDFDFALEKKVRRSTLGTGSNLNPTESRLALRDLDDAEDLKGSTLRRPLKVKKEKRQRKSLGAKKARERRSSLLAVAEQREEEQKKRKVSLRKKKGRSRSSGARALVQLLSGKKKRSRMKDGGSSPSSSGSSTDGDTEDEESSTESEVTAPLKRRSLKRPGSILKMLFSHATEALDQSAVVEMGSSSSITGGMKMATSTSWCGRTSIREVEI